MKVLLPYPLNVALLSLLALYACSSKPMISYTSEPMPLIMLPASMAGVSDERASFYQLFCQLNQQIGAQLPDYRPCNQALHTPPGLGVKSEQAIDRSGHLEGITIVLVPGLGWDCIREYLGTAPERTHVEELGYQILVPPIEGLSSSPRNAEIIHQHIADLGILHNGRKLLFIGYSKGVPDILETLINYPELQKHTLAVVSLAGAVGGTPVADVTSVKTLKNYNLVPGEDCVTADHGALESLKPSVRRRWLAENPLPQNIRYYSLVAYPKPDNISAALKFSYKKLSKIDPRNDSQLLFYDQLLPHSRLLAFMNGDHLAIAVPIAREHKFIGKLAMTHNDYPRELLLETVLRFVEAELNTDDKAILSLTSPHP